MYLPQRSPLVCDMLEYLVHEDPVKRISGERKLVSLADIEGNAGKRLPGLLDPACIHVYTSRCLRPGIKQGVRVTSVGASIIKPIPSVKVLGDASDTIFHVEWIGG